MCATLNLHLEQLDVKTTFLHGNLEEDIYMLQPEGFEENQKKNLVYRLNKSLYGLKQEPRYHIEELKAQLAREFEIKDLGSAKKILGMQIHRDRSNRKIWLSQKNYLKKILSRFNMQDLGSLMFAMICTRPDIAQAVRVVSRYMANPGKEHWNIVKRIMRYIKGTSNVALCYRGSNLLINGYVDSDYAGDLDKNKSTTGYVFKDIGGAMQLEELGHNQEYVSLFCDSQSALHLARSPTFRSRTKHIRVQYHFIREKVEEGTCRSSSACQKRKQHEARVAFHDTPMTLFWMDYVATRWYRALVLCGSFFSKQYTPAIDIWSIRCIFAEVLTGKPHFPGKNVVHQLDLMTDLVDPLALRLLQRLLAYDPKDRPTAEEALADPYFKGLTKVEREPSCQPITKMELEFKRRRVTKDDIQEVIFREILEYHPQQLKDYMNGTERLKHTQNGSNEELITINSRLCTDLPTHVRLINSESSLHILRKMVVKVHQSTIVHSNTIAPKEQPSLKSLKERQNAEEAYSKILINCLQPTYHGGGYKKSNRERKAGQQKETRKLQVINRSEATTLLEKHVQESYHSATPTLTEKSGNHEMALRVFDSMLISGQCPNEFTLSIVLRSCSAFGEFEYGTCIQARRWSQALRLYVDMVEAGVTPNEFTFVKLLGACGVHGLNYGKLVHVLADYKPTQAGHTCTWEAIFG
ncbi:Mitogen-activated protein kinase 10 [Hibiscus syriacus]|uniref:Mitogen-activated protein kinase 10 n=1 Tax=Hibiscus syriacus TaxID=106335 RepID=A0A6A3D267_HIBSY|nr:Mitogen-activated protein kinase 10 [Hibiscus syriacus]